MTKDEIISMALEAGVISCGQTDPDELEAVVRFVAMIESARDAELLANVEMPEPVVQRTKESKEKTLDDWFYASNPAYPKVHSNWNWELLFTADQLRSTVAAAVLRKDADIANLHTVMMAAAVEITEHWDAHCDEEGYGPANLVRRLENGYPGQYGYDAKTLVRVEAERDALKAENERLRADAARYNAMKTACAEQDHAFMDVLQKHSPETVEQFDAAIDAAMKEQP